MEQSDLPHAGVVFDEDKTLQPLRTLKGDIARLLGEKKIPENEFKKLDERLKKEALEYGKAGGDDSYFKKLNIIQEKEPETLRTEADPPLEEQVNKFIEKTETDIVINQMAKARREIQDLERAYFANEGAQRRYKEILEAKELLKKEAPSRVYSGDIPQTPIGTIPKEYPIPQEETIEQKKRALEEKAREIQAQINALPERSRGVLSSLEQLMDQKGRLESFISPLIAKEHEIEEEEHRIQTKETKSESKEEQRRLEEQRWVLEDRRRDIEQKRWKADQEIVKVAEKIKALEEQKVSFVREQETLEEKLKQVERKRQALTAEEDARLLKKQLDIFEKKKEPLELQWITLNENRKKIIQELENIGHSEQALEDKISQLEIKEETSAGNERHTYEVERWSSEEKRRSLEKTRWQYEDELEKMSELLKKLKSDYQVLLSEEKRIEQRISELEIIINETKIG
jgi:hypothetical protein